MPATNREDQNQQGRSTIRDIWNEQRDIYNAGMAERASGSSGPTVQSALSSGNTTTRRSGVRGGARGEPVDWSVFINDTPGRGRGQRKHSPGGGPSQPQPSSGSAVAATTSDSSSGEPMSPSDFNNLLNPPRLPQSPASTSGGTPADPPVSSQAPSAGPGGGSTLGGMQRITVPGATGYAMVPEGTNAQTEASAVNSLFSSIDQRTADGFARAQGANNLAAAQGRQQRGGPMQMDPRLQQMGEQLQGIAAMIQSGRGPNGRPLTADGMSALITRANALDRGINELYGVDADLFMSGENNARSIQEQLLRNQGQLDMTQLQGQNQLMNTMLGGAGDRNRAIAAELYRGMNITSLPPSSIPDAGSDPAGNARALAADRVGNSLLAQTGGDPVAARELALQQLRDAGLSDPEGGTANAADAALIRENPQLMQLRAGLQNLEERMASAVEMRRQTFQYAEGGLVGMDDDQMMSMPMQSFAEGGLVGQAAPPVDVQAMQNYQQYVAMAQQMGLDPVPFEQFAQMSAPQQSPVGPPMPEMQPNAMAGQQVMGFADGGMIPDMGAGALEMLGSPQVDGKMVMDTDPMAPTDSIPAMIDGQQPAALDSGEFVLPADVVMFYGTDKLNKLIEKARSPAEGALANA